VHHIINLSMKFLRTPKILNVYFYLSSKIICTELIQCICFSL
jgi:hypothetical protein